MRKAMRDHRSSSEKFRLQSASQRVGAGTSNGRDATQIRACCIAKIFLIFFAGSPDSRSLLLLKRLQVAHGERGEQHGVDDLP